MSLSTVVVTWDETDIGQAPLGGSITFQLSELVADITDGIDVHPLPPKSYIFVGGTGTSGALVANDNVNLSPAGSYYTITISIRGQAPYSFNAYINFANGASQKLAALIAAQLQPVSQVPFALPLAGGTMTGPLILASDPTAALMAATKEYVDNSAGAGVVFPSSDTTGATDQARITAAEAAAVAGTIGAVKFWPGTFWVQGLIKQSGTVWQGSGRFETIIKLASGANADVVQGANFSTLTLGGSTTGGISGWGIRDLTIDGNKAGQSGTSWGLRFYGFEFDITRVSIRNCLTDGMYSEWGGFGGSGTPDGTMEAVYQSIKIHDCGGNGWRNRGPHDSRAYDVTIFNNGITAFGYWGETNNAQTVAAGSNGVSVATFAGAGVLNVSSTLGYNLTSISATQGALSVATSGGTAVITYTGTTATSFTGCTTVSGTGTLATGGTVNPTGAYGASGCLLEGVHVWGSPLWDFVLDCQTHLIDCVGEVAQTGGGMVLVRGGNCQIIGGLYPVYSQFTPVGCGIQIGDTANACTGLRTDTQVQGLSGAGASTAAINIVNENGGCSIDAVVYQPSGTAIFGTPSASSRYRVAATGATAAANAANGLYQDIGGVRQFIPPSAGNAWRLTPGGGSTDAVNYNSTSNRWDFNNGILLQGWSGAFSGSTWQLDTAKVHMAWPSTTAPGGAIVPAAIGTAVNGASVTVTGNDRRGKITITTASSGIGAFPATVANFTFAQAYGATPRVLLTPWDGPSAAVLAYGQAFSATQFLLGFNGAPASSTTYTYTYCIEG